MPPMGDERWHKAHGRKAIMGKDDGSAVLRGPTSPTWCCSCGVAGNWASRVRCRGCNKQAPARIRSDAEKAAKSVASTPAAVQPRQPRGAWTHGHPDKGRLRQLEEQLRAAQAENVALRQGARSDAIDLEEIEGDGDGTLAQPTQDVHKVQAALDAIVALDGADSTSARELAAELEALREARRQAKPVSVQLRAVERKVAKRRKALDKGKAEVDAARAQVEAAKALLEAALGKVREAELRLQADEAELRDLVQKNAQAGALDAQAGALDAQAGIVQLRPGNDAWEAASRLVQYVSDPQVRVALLQAGMPPEQEAMALAAADIMRAAATTATLPTGHRPSGTAEAVAAMVAEGAAEPMAAADALAMELDDDMFAQMAEAAVPPAEDTEGAAEERRTKVAEAAARLKSRKGDLEKGLSKVRKLSKSRG